MNEALTVMMSPAVPGYIQLHCTLVCVSVRRVTSVVTRTLELSEVDWTSLEHR